MATISSPGVGSNLDVKTIVSQLMAVEKQPLTALAKKEASFQAKLSAFGSLKSVLSSFQSAAQTLNLSTTYSTVKASVADSAIMGASVSGAATAGTYNIEVKSLAQSQKLISSSYAASGTVVGKGTLTIDIGAYSGTAPDPVSFTAKSGSTATSITIDSGNNTLEGVRDAINKANSGVSATIINDGAGFRLSVTSKDTGTANAVRIGVAETGGAGLAQLAYDASTGGTSNMSQNVEAKDAVIKVDGITVTKPGNKITDAIQGVTLTLTKETEANVTTKLTLAQDNAAVKSALDNFVKAYNAVNKQITDSTAYNSATGSSSVLTGDATTRSIQAQLRNAMSGAVSGAPVGMSVLSDVGISFQKDGTLSLDSAKLDKVLADPLKDISKLFTSSDTVTGIGSRLNTLVSGMIFGSDAILNGRIDGINTSIKSIGSQMTAQNIRLATIEKRYNAQFSALDTAISRMMSTSTFLTQQLDALSANNS
ncbi:flagellar filament capping protein FliD [Janthinobacterium sp. 17J80-10]|uniref:flagellar filament capping protein FliD n=1 Tax=Janthinobacterium sp. 17J80-10 TaxID=2497863 RepID=UPI0019D71B52|nr:flagellar filament capping protein FliD [Janthinobacterium sp. 17J80-10]